MRKGIALGAVGFLLAGALYLGAREGRFPVFPSEQERQKTTGTAAKMETATFGAGCFWCVEAVFQDLKGVQSVVSGYTGGTTKNPTYKQVCTGTTGHAEVCQITYDPGVVSFPGAS